MAPSLDTRNPFLAPSATDDDLRAGLSPVLAELDAQRLAQAKKCRDAAMFCALGALVGLIVVGGATRGQISWPMLVPPALALIIYAFIAGAAKNEYRESFKAMVLPRLVAQFGDMSYSPGMGLSEGEFNATNLYGNPDRYSSEDLFEGRIGETHLRFAEVHAEERRQRTDSKGRTQTYYVTIFRGLFFIADFNKHFNGVTYVMPEGLTGALGSFGESLQSLGGKFGGRGELVKLEDPRFEGQFIVYSSDQTEARYILSSSLMERFCNLRDRYNGGTVAAVFQGGSVYLMISTNHNWFEPPSLGTPIDFDALSGNLRELQQTTGIVSDLDLNTRIWSKE